jgi:glycosyltransferase involved in cell wall biosynthesis
LQDELSQVGWVVIGRNEGDRLIRCFESINGNRKVYVDSGSTDNSLHHAVRFGFDIVNLDMKTSFTAARARNEGWHRLLLKFPDTKFIMFVDGDCVVCESFIPSAIESLLTFPAVAVVFGHRKERFPEKSIYNRLCDFEWSTPIGDALACGGDAMFRSETLVKLGGYSSGMIAGEEPELCFRIRLSGQQVLHIDSLMTLHDSAMYTFAQWWQRTKRGGYAFALGYWMHHGKKNLWRREFLRAVFWGICLPFLFVCFSLGLLANASSKIIIGCFLAIPIIYVFQLLKVWIRFSRHSDIAFMRSWFLLIGKFAEAFGIIRFAFDRANKRPGKIIEYK